MKKLFLLIMLILFVSSYSEVIDKIVARVNDQVITDFDIRLLLFMQRNKMSYDSVLKQLLDENLIIASAKDMDYKIQDEQVNYNVDQTIANQRAKYGSDKLFLDALKNEGLMLSSLKENYRKQIKNSMLKEQILDDKVKKRISITTDEVSKYYDNNKLWVVTIGGGYSIFDGTNWTTHNRASGFVSNHVQKIEKDKDGNVWIATYSKGIIKYDGENYTYYTDENGITDQVWTSFIDSKNNIWIGTSELGAAKFDGENWSYFNSDNSPLLNSVNDIFEDKDGNYWFATFNDMWNGLICRYDGEIWKTFTPLDKGSVDKILQDSKGNIWFAYSFTDSKKNEIIVKYDGDRFDVVSLSTELPEDTIFSDFKNGIYTIYEDKDSLLWFGLGEHGVLTYDGENWKHLTKKEGFPWSGVRDIIQDDKGNYYFASDDQGVFKWVVKHDDIKTQVQKKAPFNVFPNPVKDVLHIKNDNHLIKTTQVELYDVNGRLLYTNYYHSNYELNMSSYPKGIYIVKLKYFNYVYSKKIVKE